MKSVFASKRLSLLWKVLLVLFLFQSIVLIVYAYLSKQELNNRFTQEKANLKTTSATYFEKAIKSHAYDIQDSIYALTYSEVTSVQALTHHFSEQWDSLSVEWGLSGVAIYDFQQKSIYQQGKVNLSSIKRKLDQLDVIKEPISYLVCLELCKVNILVPLRFDEKAVFLLISTNLIGPISKFQDILQLETAIVTTNSTFLAATKQPDMSSVASNHWLEQSLTMLRKDVDPFHYELLSLASKQSDFGTLLAQGNRIKYGEKHYFITGFNMPLEERTTSYLIIFNDISETNKLDDAFNRSYLWFSLFTLIILFFVILIVLWRPIARIKKLRDYLPLLATDSPIDIFPTLTHSRLFIDEIDVLEKTSTDLANKLNQLNSVVYKREAELKEIAMFDSLTGLANRTHFLKSLKKSVSEIEGDSTFVTLFFIDLDRFKQINDTLGHHVGDGVLKVVAKRIKNTIRGSDLVARLGGDEFIVLLKNLHNRKSIINIVNLLLKSFEQPANIFDIRVNIQLSIGITLITDSTATTTEVIKQADIAMYSAKNNKDKRYSFFESNMESTIVNQFNLINDFSNALIKGEFQLYFQPLYSFERNNLIGFECLIRWQHPERGQIMPDVFLPILQKTKYMRELEYWILEEGIRSCKNLNLISSMPITCAINVSADMFMLKNMNQKIQHLLAEFELSPKLIDIEIVEDTLVQDIEVAIERCNELRSSGVSISIDDFGVGYSSLNYLRRIPADNIKIDRSFIVEIEKQETDESHSNLKVLSSLIDLLLSLNKTIIAEGIETKEQRNWLAKQGCTVGQGYFYGKPQPYSSALSLVLLENENVNVVDFKH